VKVEIDYQRIMK